MIAMRLAPDGLLDLNLKFKTQEVVSLLQQSTLESESVMLSVSGTLLDGRSFTASDCVLIVPSADLNNDNVVNMIDLALFAEFWLWEAD